jgi:hypothetical protein
MIGKTSFGWLIFFLRIQWKSAVVKSKRGKSVKFVGSADEQQQSWLE